MKTKILVLVVLVVIANQVSSIFQTKKNNDRFVQGQFIDGRNIYDQINTGAGFIQNGKAQQGPPPDGAPPGPPPDGAPPGPPPDGAPPGPPPEGTPPGPPPTVSTS